MTLDLFTILPLATLAMTGLNLLTWPRGPDESPTSSLPKISVLIPARNEEGTIGACVRAALREPVHEVVVYDDGSTDHTPEILHRMNDPRLRVIRGAPLPEGWVGKPHACHRLSEAAEGDLYLFIDADVSLLPGALARLVALRRAWRANVLTAVPAQQVETLAEQLVVPLLHLTYTSWLPNLAVPILPFTSMLAANGQILAVDRRSYARIGGFEAVRDAVVDDMAFCRRAKQLGQRVLFADGHFLGRCRMYTSWREVWAGFSKNIYSGVGHPALMVLVLALYVGAFLLPWLLLVVGWWVPALLPAALVGVAANILQRAVLALRHEHPVASVVLHPLGIAALLAIALNSWRWARRGTIHCTAPSP